MRIAFSFWVGFFPLLAAAQSSDSSFTEMRLSGAAFSDIEMSEIDRKQYDLSEEEISRTRRLRVIDRSYGVSNLSAVELLGKYAKTDAERMKYARKHVTAMADNVGRSQAWSFAVYEASQETNLVGTILNGNPSIGLGLDRLRMAVPAVDYSDFGTAVPIRETDPGRVLMITPECGDECDAAFVTEFLLVMENKVDHVDVVFVNSSQGDTDDIFDWAKSMAISKDVLESGKVNLHMDDTSWRDLREGSDEVPRVIRKGS